MIPSTCSFTWWKARLHICSDWRAMTLKHAPMNSVYSFTFSSYRKEDSKQCGHLGFRNRSKEIARLVTDQQADLLVIGAHRHRGLKDWLYGETINSVRHEINIPVLVVNVGN